ncbi:peptidoglycan DD-metalloendopeptidase family protein [Dasania sp. GY-MA-18]|uniref:Peptidoglycan DD-metalloendopeptidase family protein n=1 Tax=Dasania phycosphaerae TaxID=2950436 RepID=A0A9J6RMC1_9GAMM|nr:MULTISPECIES: peptidoglycan DD-metalloendopeptidase family protein [Dasania]MCR8923034.1 peptidoglycan DD-metalloendopeptidase family protein [Dasania sp. GY-MA-18]MCZ0865465.1 peptidoglycan DD-metalloendopeptidase family protein [Dasania phycosphaerae]MCZ0869190.1 peptidoglycan DD-metalloendopeptidase family protein [Dasania phycosphaerae]
MANMRLPLAIFVLRRAVYLALCACLCLNISAALADDSRANKAQLQQLSKEVAQLKKLLSGFQSQRSELENALRQAEINIGQLQTQISKTQQQLNSEQKALQQLQSQRHALQGQKRQQQQQIEQQIRSAFQIGQQKKLKVLLNQEDPEKLSRALAYYDYFNRARAQQVSAYADTIANINKLEPAIQQKTETLKQAKAQLQQEHKALLSNKSTREQSLAKINSSIKSKHQHLSKLNQDRAELERLIEAVEQTIANISIPTDYRPFAQLKGKLPWPLVGKASNSFGSRRSNSELRWQGVNIRANAGSSIKAIHHGRVVFSDWLRGYGLLIIIDHGDDYMSLYGHNQSLLRETGDWVSSGEIIATTGNSGGQQQSGVYFEIRHNGKPSNPALWCKRS